MPFFLHIPFIKVVFHWGRRLPLFVYGVTSSLFGVHHRWKPQFHIIRSLKITYPRTTELSTFFKKEINLTRNSSSICVNHLLFLERVTNVVAKLFLLPEKNACHRCRELRLDNQRQLHPSSFENNAWGACRSHMKSSWKARAPRTIYK